MTILWTSHAAAEAMRSKSRSTWQAKRVEIDSRRVQPGDLFVALGGENFDGHDYVADALAKGAVAAVVSTPLAIEGDLLVVPDTLKALEDLAHYARKRSHAKIVGVTGSVGKTSAKEMLRLALSAHGKTYATTGNYNNHIGTPLNLANLPTDADFGVFEMGMNHAGEIAHLTRIVQPHVAVITNIEAVHMEFFASIEAIAEAKAEIFAGLGAQGIAVLNRDNAMYPLLAKLAKEQGANVVTFGEHAKANCRLLDYGAGGAGCAIGADIYGYKLRYTLQAVGRQWATASLLTLAVTHAFGLDDEETAAALADFSELEGRGQVLSIAVNGGHALLIDDSYNASPASMRAAFAKTAEVWESGGRRGRKLAALGNMLELGPDAPKLHAGLAADLQQAEFDGVFTAGEWMRHLHDALPEAMRAEHVGTAAELLPILQQQLRAGDILLVKGSHGSKIYALATQLMSAAEDVKHAV